MHKTQAELILNISVTRGELCELLEGFPDRRKAKGFCQRFGRGNHCLFTGQLFLPYHTFHMDMYVNDRQWTGDEEA
ncbi:hypothetical protein CRENBAI_011512 [Crenichthys baileyi]|uniref:Uncharacterized protein n=1 Tax=Crenichthys baileyi TaxID=28760 RepID=A0AAV9SL95_9TELE